MTIINLICFFLFNLFLNSNESRLSITKINVQPVQFLNAVVLQNQTATEDRKSIYMKYCLTCHQTDGGGVPQMFPPIKNSNWVNGDKDKLLKVLINGLSGEIEVNEEYYDQTMPKFDYLTNDQISKVLTYIRQNFNNNASPVTINEVITGRNLK